MKAAVRLRTSRHDNEDGQATHRLAGVRVLDLSRLLAAGAAAGQMPAVPSAHPLKIVLHVSDPDGWAPALSNAKNLSAQHPSIKVMVVTDGSGVYGLQGTNDLTSLMAVCARGGVQFEACNNALDEKRIAPASLPAFVKVVPAGVIALAQAQADGYAYIKP